MSPRSTPRSMNPLTNAKAKRNRSTDSSDSLKSAATSRFSRKRSRKQMEMWQERSDFHELHFLQLLHSIMSNEYTVIGKTYDRVFWENFTAVFNDRIRAANDGQHRFIPFSVANVVDANLFFREKANKFNHVEQYPNKELLESCYLTCHNCCSLPVHPFALSTSGRTHSRGSSGRTRSRGASSGTRSHETPVHETLDGTTARDTLIRLYHTVDENNNLVLRTKYFLKGLEFIKADIANCKTFNELGSDKKKVKFIKSVFKSDNHGAQ